MTSLLNFRFLVAAMLLSMGWYALLAHWSDPALFFCYLPIVTMSRSDMLRPVPRRDVLVFIGFVFTFGIVIMAGKWVLPSSVAAAVQRVVQHPAFVLSFWILSLWSLYRIYRRQKAEVNA